MSAVKSLSLSAVVVALIALAAFLVSHLPDAVMMTIIAVLCGAVASIPVAFGLLLALAGNRNAPKSVAPAPRVIIVERNPKPLRGDWRVSKPSALAKRDESEWDA